MTIEQKLEKRIKGIIELKGEYPSKMYVTNEELEQLRTDNFREVKLIVK